MKVKEFIATGNDVQITLEPEHPAEIALLRLMDQAKAECGSTDSADPSSKDCLIVNAHVKAGRGY